MSSLDQETLKFSAFLSIQVNLSAFKQGTIKI